MAITTTRSGAAIDSIVTSLKALAVDPQRVFDGPSTAGDTMWTQAIFIGFDGNWGEGTRGLVNPGSVFPAVQIDQQLCYLGTTSVLETMEIQGSAESWSGDVTVQTIRNQALAMLNLVEQVLRTDPTLGIDGSTIATLKVGTLHYTFDDDNNLGAQYPFTIHVQTTLLTV